ncbi:MAG: nitrite reductase (NAD(P)H) [Haliea sp.]|nr:nitrite reductase (NAD(P)H) [Haliea sp.]
MNKPRLVVIGNGMVGQRFLEEMVERGHPYEITVFCEEPVPAYDRVQLSSWFSGATADDLALTSMAWFREQGIKLVIGEEATCIDRERREVTGSRGTVVAYDELVLATGSYPFVPPIPGSEREACLVYRTLEDLGAIQAAAQTSRVGAVVGGGLLGLEAAKALQDLGLETHVVEFAPQLMGVQLDGPGGALLRRKIEELGVQVHTGKATQHIEDGADCRHRMVFADGELETDLVLFSAGIRPRDALARDCGLLLGERGGVVIDDRCRTSDPAIYAIGEVALWQQRIFGLVAPGYDMARQLAAGLCGDADAAFRGADMSTKLKLLGVEVGSIGDAHGRTPGSHSCSLEDSVAGVYKKLVISEDGSRLLGAVLVGDTGDYGSLLQYCLNGIDLPPAPLSLILPAGEGKPALGVDALPDSAQICSCNNVSKGDLCAAVSGGCTTIGALKAETRASATCGGCSTLVKQVMDAELKRQGVEVTNHLCAHFPYSRQELYHLVRVNELRSFDALLQAHGSGLGCEICKPAVASILASCWNDYVLDPRHVGLQDTNDNFLANLQKDGSYSVVPRVPGGEITPEKLCVLGEVAQRYDLYTKITGGQRIDLFGARVEQLPAIWRELVDAGFESGHAYGKALRTVKSCVGSTWCRYGVQDSVGMAIFLEERYRGIRSPHKLKMAVSGCTRECAEAQGKDVGVIATEKGWNLYVCGNGGMRPRHAELFASDLDDATLVRTIDRFLMFYIATADRLQRTSVWRDNLEGGLAYLQAVILEDSLGIAAELESQMQALVDSYVCEWKRTIEDPEALKRFRPFVNDERGDEQIVYVRERGQKRPARPEEKAEVTAHEPQRVLEETL